MTPADTSDLEPPDSPFWRWEGLRVPYNLTLLAVVVAYLTLVNPDRFYDSQFQQSLVQGAILLNLLFLAGFAVESVFTAIGLGSMWLTTVLFFCGLFLASFLTLIALFSLEFQRVLS